MNKTALTMMTFVTYFNKLIVYVSNYQQKRGIINI